MASNPINSWQTEGEKVEAGDKVEAREKVETDFIFLGFKVTADRDCGH